MFFFLVCHVYSGIGDDILTWKCEVWLELIMECDLVYDDLEGFCPFQNTHIERVHLEQSISIYLRSINPVTG
jgi:hypothetical protein